MKKYTVYSHRCLVTNKVYIGITCQKPENRWGGGKNYRGCKYFYNAIIKYGWDNFEHFIIATNLSKQEACKLETSFINVYKSLGMSYNITDGGEGVSGTHHSPESRAKISKTRKGIQYSESTLKRMSESHKGKKLTDVAKAKISKPVIQMDLQGNVLARWNSIADAARTLGLKSRSKISECCRNRRMLRGKLISKPTAYGYKWKFEDSLDI